MSSLSAIAVLGVLLMSAGSAPHDELPVVHPNPNLDRAGVLRDGILTVSLEARQTTWWADGPHRPPMVVAAFAEAGKAPLVPAPLIRVAQGTEVRVSVRNSLSAPLTFLIPAAIHGGQKLPKWTDSVVIAPKTTGTLTVRATTTGNYMYRALMPDKASKEIGVTGLLTGAIVVDTSGSPAAHDRVFVITAAQDSILNAYRDTVQGPPQPGAPVGRVLFMINGRSWPNTERIHATVGDSLRWRVINASWLPHPMHLHGFYYRIDEFSGQNNFSRPTPGEMVVTQLLPPYTAMSMSWSPDRPGNWIFHCHLAIHLEPDSISAEADDPHMMGMVGLVLGVDVAQRPGAQAAAPPAAPARRLRLIAVEAPLPGRKGVDNSVPSMRFDLEEHGQRVESKSDISPELDLTRGEPVSIMIVNRLSEPTSVHWHGIELQDSYMDGVMGFSGTGGHRSPEIAPGDSFEARFTPPRAGTFMYHVHMDEMRAEIGGLEGALIVRDSATAPSADDHVFFLKGINGRLRGSRLVPGESEHPFEINGTPNPDTIVLHIGRSARFRLLNLSTVNFAPVAWLTARPDSSLLGVDDTMTVQWRPLAKDGFDVPADARTLRPASQYIAIGETYDFEYVPTHAGNLRLEIRQNGRQRNLLARVPIRVE
jgi:FtsP/CotA-like multicopper oxidase with cupredoxin domain